MPSLLKNPHLMLMLTTLIWGGNAIAGRFAVGHISPMALTWCRWAIAFLIIVAIGHRTIRADWGKLKDNWLYLLLMGGFGYTAFNFCLYSALQYSSAITVTLEQSAMPLVIFIINFVLFRIGITWLQLLGYGLTVIGVIVTATRGAPLSVFSGEGQGLNLGDVFMLMAALFYGGYSVALRKKPEMNWQSFLAGLVLGGFVFACFGVVAEGWWGQTLWPQTVTGFAVALYAGIFPSLVSQGLFIAGVAALGANRAGLYINMVPIFGALLAVLLLDETLHLFHAVAFLLVVGGVMLAQRSTPPSDTTVVEKTTG